MTQVVDALTEVLESLSYSVDEDSLVQVVSPTGTVTPALVGGKKLILPTQPILKRGIAEDEQVFNPFCESLSRLGTSPVQQHLQRSAKQNISFYVVMLADALLKMSNDTKLHPELPPSMADLLMKLSNAGINEKTQGFFDKLIPAAREQNRLVTVFLKGPTTFMGKSVNRVATIRFPILEELDNDADKNQVLGITIPAKQRKALSALLRMVIPNGDCVEEYSAGTISRTAPYFAVFLEAYHKVMTRLNLLTARLEEPLQLPIRQLPMYSLDMLAQFAKYAKALPVFPGNDGAVDSSTDEAPQAAQARSSKFPATAAAFTDPHQQAKVPAARKQAAPTSAPATNPFIKTQEPAPYEAPAPVAPQYGYLPPAPTGGWSTNQIHAEQPQRPQFGSQLYAQQPAPYHQQPQYNQPRQGPAPLPWGRGQQQQPMYSQQPQNPFMAVFANTTPQPQYQQPQYYQQPNHNIHNQQPQQYYVQPQPQYQQPQQQPQYYNNGGGL